METLGIFDSIKVYLDEVETRFYKELKPEGNSLAEIISHISKYKGKRLRPALVLLSGKCVGEILPQHIDLAVVVEMVHTATLVHDDIIDEATMRRHVESVNSKWGREISILFGDYLFSRGFTILSALDSQVATLLLSQTVNIMSEGEIIQLQRRYDIGLNEKDYFDIIERKTASLCAASCRLGATFAGANRKVADLLFNYGLKTGIAFQIVDDCLDVMGTEEEIGKSLNTDIQKGKLTLPLIRLVNQLPKNKLERTRELIFQHDVNETKDAIMDLLTEHDAVEYAFNTARNFVKQAQDEIAPLPDSKYKTTLLELADYIVERRK
ncbi:MAG: polyprenyl synthetase family protein [Candidatus Loosdrechtia sp.]|uniref:polyprenyl synthetase family protein n=1 Tax=Candidatus Loosdrechtia sp. TaxID=3101272 RepID=UPI003A71CCD9|nr:MAG: polyprenyl synthetase family protein [Candidatus Jettenia sp. AMX2]